jgi:hypothetical protein
MCDGLKALSLPNVMRWAVSGVFWSAVRSVLSRCARNAALLAQLRILDALLSQRLALLQTLFLSVRLDLLEMLYVIEESWTLLAAGQ